MIGKETVESGAEHPGTPLRIITSNAGYYLGYLSKDGSPYSRESEYFASAESAERALDYWKGGCKVGLRT